MKYEKYKDSGVKWIGEIPEYWKVIKLKFISKFINGFAFKSDSFSADGEYPVIRIGDIVNEKISYENIVFVSKSKDLDEYRIITNDILIAMSGATVGKVGICQSKDKGYINQRVGIIRSKDYKLIWYNLLSPAFLEYIYLMSNGAAQPNISSVGIGNYYVPFPPIYEQQTIATYLDEKCGEINRAIDVQKKKIDLLNELKQTIITDAVTKGLDPNATMKDSGVEWIGEIPAHWEVRKIKYICKSEKFSVKTGPFGSQLKGQDLQPEGDVCVYNQRNVIGGQFEETQFFVSNNKAKTLTSFYTKPLDLLVTSRGTIGKCAILPKDRPIGILHPCLIALRINQHICDLIWAKIFINDSVCFATNIFLNSNATTIEVIYTDTLKNIVIPIPPIQEQQMIITHIENETGKIDSQISKANRRIELLEELKQSIITEAVTGKIKVC